MPWNPLIPDARRLATNAQTTGRPVVRPTHVVCHITGSNSLESVLEEFQGNSASPHYLVDKQGLLYQFVKEEDQAWHAGIRASVQPLYAEPPTTWRKYLYCFPWYSYPQESVYVDANLRKVQGKSMATFVRQPNSEAWPLYDYFIDRWGDGAGPVNYKASKRPNAYSIGIEILSLGAKNASASAYTPAMYASLRRLVEDICERNDIPMEKGRVVGHEDVNPVQRFGWDPNQGFDWSQVWT